MSGRFVPALALALFLSILQLAYAQDNFIPRAQDRPPGPALSPSEAIARMTVPEGFQVELVASEPDLVNPVAMTFDERGRVWVTESLEYPRREPGTGRDRVKILEDTDGDGKADKFTTFAEGLNIPSGIAVGAGGVWVANAPDILFLKDSDGDGKADTKEVVVTGFGREDTHELPNSLTWGPDGYLYGWNGVFNPARIDYRGKHYEFTCAIFRIDPKTRDFEVFCEGTSNPWGLAWDKEGSAFASACVIDHLWHLTETGYYHRQGGPYPPFTWKLESIVGHDHQKAAYCGITYFDSDAFPEKYRERLFMGNIHGNAINVDRLERHGATYRGHTEGDFLSANDAWFMPVVQKVGPDGSLYVLDWYDRYHCYQDANRDPAGVDRLKGRLYRVRYKDTPRAPAFDLARESDDDLIARLSSPNVYFRENAQRLLRERDSQNPGASRPRLAALAKDQSAPRKARLHAVWALAGMANPDPNFLKDLMSDPDPTFRAWGVRIVGNSRKVPGAVFRVLALIRDESPDVRVQVAIASRKLELLDPLPALYETLARAADDPIIPAIAWQNLHPLLDDRGDDFATLLASADLEKSPRLAGLFPRTIERLLGGSKVQPEPAAAILSRLLAGRPEGETLKAARRSLEILAERIRGGSIGEGPRKKLIALTSQALTPTLSGDPENPLFFEAAIVASSWKDPAAIKALAKVHGDEKRRLRAINARVSAGDASVLDLARDEFEGSKPASSNDFRAGLIEALGGLDVDQVATILLQGYPRLEPDLKPKALELLTQRPGWARALLDAIDRREIAASALNLNQVRKLATGRDRGLADRTRAIFGTVREARNPAREQVIERMKATFQGSRGDAVAGATVFRNVCGQCHKIYGEGQEVGPDVTLNGRGSFDQLLSNVFDPSLVIGPAFQATTVATTDGRVLTGLVVEDSPQRLVLKLQGGKLEAVAKSTVEESKLSPLSMMPEGLETQVTPKELADLFAYITLDRPPADPEARPIPGTPAGIRK